MAKTTGLGDNFYVGGYDLSGDTQSLGKISGSIATLDVTDITQSAISRLGGQRDGGIDWVSYFDPAANASHVALSALPTADTICSYFQNTAIGNPAACLNAKQVNYDPTRDNAGMLTVAVNAVGQGFGLEWGTQLTAGKRTDTTATTGAFFQDTAGTNFGGQAYFQLFAFSGTSVTIDIQSSTTSGGAYATTGLTSQAFTAAPGFQRVSVSNVTTINQFLKVVTTGTFTNAVFAVVFVRNLTSGIVF